AHTGLPISLVPSLDGGSCAPVRSGVVTRAMTHRDVVTVPNAHSNFPIPAFRDRVGRVITDHINVSQLFGDLVCHAAHIADPFGVVHGSAARRGDVFHEIAATAPSARPRLRRSRSPRTARGRRRAGYVKRTSASGCRPRERKRKRKPRYLIARPRNPAASTSAATPATSRIAKSVDQHIRFRDQVDRIIVARSTARCVVSVGKEDQCFASFNVAKLSIYRFVHRVVNTRAAAHVRSANRPLELAAIAGELAQIVYVSIKRDHHHAILVAQLANEGYGSVLNILYASRDAGA